MKKASIWTKPVQIESTIDTQITKGQVSVARSGNLYFVGRILAERTPAPRQSGGTRGLRP